MAYPPLFIRATGPRGFDQQRRFTRPTIKIGSAPSADVWIPDAVVDLAHAVIEQSSSLDQPSIGRWVVDLHTAVGTTLNGRQISTEALRDGDVIGIGSHELCVSTEGSTVVSTALACPRCERPLQEARWTMGGGYRDGVSASYLRCELCAISVVGADMLRTRFKRSEPRLGGTALERHRRPSEASCPRCLARLDRLTISWATLWVELEECQRCGEVVMDDGEGQLLAQLFAARDPEP